MASEDSNMIFQGLKAPRAAAVAGILFAVFYGSGVTLIRLAVPENPGDAGEWMPVGADSVAVGLSLFPFAGVAFLWFIGVIRDRIGSAEDQFLSTVFLGSGLLFLGLTFVSAAFAGGVLSVYADERSIPIERGAYRLFRAATFQISNIYAIKMASVFMISLATISIRTARMPRWLAFLTYALALGLLFGIASSLWATLIFPVWVGGVSVCILMLNWNAQGAPDAKP